MEVEIISKQHIKPSSPTPHHLRTYKLSLLDQCIPLIHVSMLLYFPIANQKNPIQKDTLSIEEKLQLLKKSLSQTLSRFYPLAGKIKDNLSIDCNDQGIYYVEARVKSNLSEFLSQPDLALMHNFLPCNPSWKESNVGDKVFMVQVNVFDCGGIAIGLHISHMLGDGIALSTFLSDWCATARGCDGAISPDFTTTQTRFPQNYSFPKELSVMDMFNPFFKIGKSVTRRFVFDASGLAMLKAKSKSSRVQKPSRVEVVSALIWKCIMSACKANSGIQKPSLVTHAVNLRQREVPPLSDYLMGNYIGVALAQCTAETEADTELGNLVHELRESTANINGEFLKNLEGDHGFHIFCEALKEMGGVFSRAAISNKGAEYVMFTSWGQIGFYEVDFGWGTPIWVTYSGPREEEASVVVNFVCLMKNKQGDSIEALVALEEQDMAVLECDKELLTYASLNPSLLKVGHLASRM